MNEEKLTLTQVATRPDLTRFLRIEAAKRGLSLRQYLCLIITERAFQDGFGAIKE